MMKNEIFNALNKLEDYQGGCPSGVKAKYVATTPTSDQWTYDGILDCVHINSPTTSAMYFAMGTKELKIGDIIEVEVEVANVNGGDNGKIVINRLTNSSDLFGATNSYYQVLSDNTTNMFKKVKSRYIVPVDGFYRISCGVFNELAGEIKIRNFKMKAYSSIKEQPKVEKSSVRKAFIQCDANRNFTVRTDYGSDAAAITTSGANNTVLVITWDKPLEGLKPVTIVSEDLAGNSPKYRIRVGQSGLNSVSVRFYDISTNAEVAISNLDVTSPIYFYIISMN